MTLNIAATGALGQTYLTLASPDRSLRSPRIAPLKAPPARDRRHRPTPRQARHGAWLSDTLNNPNRRPFGIFRQPLAKPIVGRGARRLHLCLESRGVHDRVGAIAIVVIGALAAAVHGRVGQGAAHGDASVSDGLWDDRTMS